MAGLVDKLLGDRSDKLRGITIPQDVKTRADRGRKAMLRDAPKRRLCMRFEKGETYWYLNEKNQLMWQDTVTKVGGGGKPPHRIRNTYNFIRPIVEGKVSAATQRIPSYEISPSTTDPEDVGGARLAEKVALYGYDKWRLRRVSIKTVKLAIAGGGDGFAVPYFDPNVGPFVEVEPGEWVGQGEIKVMVLSGNEVYWEPGVDFFESRWHAIERAMPIDEVEALPGFVGGKLSADAAASEVPTDKRDAENLVMVTQFFERPCQKYPEGRMFWIANGQQIVDYRLIDPTTDRPWEPYPLKDADGEVVDEPIPHRLSYTLDPDTDRDLGLVWQLIDPQRTVQDCWNKLLEWKNRCLNPQMIAPVGSNMVRKTDEPGAVFHYQAVNNTLKPEWETPPPVPQALFQMLEQMKRDMRELGADSQLEAAPDVAARALQAVNEQDQARWQSFLGDVAEWHSRLMRHCLLLVARHYSEPRLLQIKGRFGPELVSDFRGQQLMDQVDVTVLPGSILPRTQAQIEQRIMMFADRGWITPMQAMAAISGGTAEKLIEGFELDQSRANRIIQKIRDGSVMEMPTRDQIDPATGQLRLDPMTGEPEAIPTWMPDSYDNPDIWLAIFSDWLKTEDFERLDRGLQEVAKQIFAGIQWQQAQQQQQAMLAQTAQAEQLGMDNAAKPVRAKPLPDQRQPAPQPGT